MGAVPTKFEADFAVMNRVIKRAQGHCRQELLDERKWSSGFLEVT